MANMYSTTLGKKWNGALYNVIVTLWPQSGKPEKVRELHSSRGKVGEIGGKAKKVGETSHDSRGEVLNESRPGDQWQLSAMRSLQFLLIEIVTLSAIVIMEPI